MQNLPINETASMTPEYHCSECGWPVVHACCNDVFNTFKNAIDCDYWMYCSNKGCQNHEGHGVLFNWPEWCVKNER